MGISQERPEVFSSVDVGLTAKDLSERGEILFEAAMSRLAALIEADAISHGWSPHMKDGKPEEEG